MRLCTWLLVLVWALPGHARVSDRMQAEADRLERQARIRRGLPGGAVDLIRLARLGDWLPDGDVERRLGAAAQDRRRSPLNRAVAWWLLHQRALYFLDIPAAQRAQEALGLITQFVYRGGPAPKPVEQLVAKEWEAYPEDLGHGVIRLESLVRPAKNHRASLATRLVSPRGEAAVLRLGYDDAVTVWLNGDEIYVSPAEHRAWLDQAAIPIALRPGDNHLVIEVRQQTGAWRVIARLTDADGIPLKIKSFADPWGPVGERATIDAPDPIAHLWSTLRAEAEVEPPNAVALRDMALYAEITGLPDRDQSIPRVLIEGAWEDDPSPRTLRAWLRLLPEDQRADVRASHPPVRPITEADDFADLSLMLARGWTHYYARRHREARRVIDALIERDPQFLPVYRLRAVLFEDLGLSHTAVAQLRDVTRRWPDRSKLRQAYTSALRSGKRVLEALDALQASITAQRANVEAWFELASMRRERGEVDEAVALLDQVVAMRPGLRGYALEAADILWRAGRRDEARERWTALYQALPGDVHIAGLLADSWIAAGDVRKAQPYLKAAGRKALRVAPVDRLGPSIETLAKITSPPDTPAHVLYHHARARVRADGRAVRWVRRVVRVLNEEGARRFTEWSLPYVPSTQRLTVESARLIRPGAPPASPARSDRDLSEPEYRLYYDLRAEILTFSRPRPGDLIEVVWRLDDLEADPVFPNYYGELAYLQEATPRALSVVEIGPDPLQIRVAARGLSVKRTTTAVGRRFEARDVPGIPQEDDMPGGSTLRAYVHASTVKGWAEVDQMYQTLIGRRDQPTAKLTALAQKWRGDAATPRDVLARLYAGVAHRTRYVGLEFGTHSFQPEDPSVTLARGYGDCKDKATLLVALIRSQGIDANLVLVRTRRSGVVDPLPASFALFDHAIVYIPSLDVFMDPTVDRNDPWTLPPSDQWATSLIIGQDPKLRRIPAQPADHNRSRWVIEADLRPDGTVLGTAEWTTHGHPASMARRALEADGTRQSAVERALFDLFPGARLGPVSASGLTPAFDPVTVSGAVELPAFPKKDGVIDIPLGPGHSVVLFAQSASRQVPLVFEYQWRQAMRMVLTLPPAHRVKLPEPVDLVSPFGRFQASARLDKGAVVIERTLTMSVMEVSPEDYSAFRAWLAEADAGAQRLVEVRGE